MKKVLFVIHDLHLGGAEKVLVNLSITWTEANSMLQSLPCSEAESTNRF